MASTDFTARLGLPFVLSNQAQKHVTVNENLRTYDALFGLSVIDRGLASPPVAPAGGDRYLVGATATSEWSGHEGEIAAFADGGWLFFSPVAGWRMWVENDARFQIFDGSLWRDTTPGDLQNLTVVGLGATADAGNPLLAKLNATLFTALETANDGSGDLRFKLNKESSGNVLSMLFQDNYSTRAEVGLIGDDDFLFKVSPDGSSFYEGIRLDKDTGRVSFPSGAAYDNTSENVLEADDLEGAIDEVLSGPPKVRQRLRSNLGLTQPDVVLRNHVNEASWLSSTSAADNQWFSVCWSPELGLLCAVASTGSGNRVMTSQDGIVWTLRTSAADNDWRSVCWSPELGLFCAVASTGGGNRVMTSPDGIVWTLRTSAADNQWFSICWSPELGLFCAVASTGSGNRVMTSPDGISWTSRTSAADNTWYSVCWAAEPGLFCAVSYSGAGNRVMTSPDGIVWTTRVNANANQWWSVCWSPELGLFCAVALNGTGDGVMTSPDGIVWTARVPAADNQWRSVCWAPSLGLFCAVSGSGSGSRVMTSPDGIDWTLRISAADNDWRSFCWSPELGLFCAVASNGTGDRVMTSISSKSYTYRS